MLSMHQGNSISRRNSVLERIRYPFNACILDRLLLCCLCQQHLHTGTLFSSFKMRAFTVYSCISGKQGKELCANKFHIFVNSPYIRCLSQLNSLILFPTSIKRIESNHDNPNLPSNLHPPSFYRDRNH